MQPVTRLARFAVSDAVWKNDEEFCRIERLIFAEEFACEFWTNELGPAASCPVHDQNRVGDFAIGVFRNLPQRAVMNFQFRQRFPGSEFEIVDGIIAFGRRWVVGRGECAAGYAIGDQKGKNGAQHAFEHKRYQVTVALPAESSVAVRPTKRRNLNFDPASYSTRP